MPTLPLKEAAELMIEKDINRLLVTEKGKAVGNHFQLRFCGQHCQGRTSEARYGRGRDV